MSKVYDAMMREQRRRDEVRDPIRHEHSLPHRLRGWMNRLRPIGGPELPPGRDPLLEPSTGKADTTLSVYEELASLRVAVDALDDRLSAEVVEREAKLLEEIRRGLRGLETELSACFAAAALDMKRSVQRGIALVVGFVALLSGVVVGVLSQV